MTARSSGKDKGNQSVHPHERVDLTDKENPTV